MRLELALLGSITALLAGCAASGGTTADLSVSALADVNETSPTFGQELHPKDYAGAISGWYFGHAT